MIGLVRAVALCGVLALGLSSAQAADKAFKRDDLADSAIKLEAQIKSEAGAVNKSASALRNDADAAFKRNDYRTGLQIVGQIAATAPDDSGNWLRLARTIFQIRANNSSEQTFLLDRRLYRLSARRQCGRRGGCAGRARPGDVRAEAVAAGTR
jgi:alpha-2-macroglobulin